MMENLVWFSVKGSRDSFPVSVALSPILLSDVRQISHRGERIISRCRKEPIGLVTSGIKILSGSS